jgi:trans-aconitate 2-methyltransferase
MRIADLGCGTGEGTKEAHRRLAARETLGLDRSPAMLARARQTPSPPGVRFELADLATFAGDPPVDLILSNAALHWVPDHETVLASLTRALAQGGQLAIQVPANFDHPSHLTADEVAAEAPFAASLGGRVGLRSVLAPERYARLLHELGYAEQRVRMELYAVLLPSRDGVVDWISGSLFADARERLSADLYAAFVQRYRERLLPRLADERPFFYPYKRILMWGRKPDR